jgi:hypothetical protein
MMRPPRLPHLGVIFSIAVLGLFRNAAAESRINVMDSIADEAHDAIVVATSNIKTAAADAPGLGPQPKSRDANPLWDIPLTSLASTRERPIFSRSRRPPAVIAAPSPAQPSLLAVPETKPPVALVGAIAAGKDGIAIFVDAKTQAVFRLKTGESHSGWTLLTVAAREVKLQKQGQSATFVMPISMTK